MKLPWTELMKYKGLLAGALGLATVNQIFSLLDPLIFQIIVDRYATKVDVLGQWEFITGVGLLLLGVVGVAFVFRVAKAFQDTM